jgi:uncharacterized membrane protein YccF (DUF307 family)
MFARLPGNHLLAAVDPRTRDEYFGREDIGTGPLGVIGNIVWLLLAG